MKPDVLVFIDWFDPAFRAGGPITSIRNFVMTFMHTLNIHVVTSAYDVDGRQVVEDSDCNRWMPYGQHAKVIYLQRHKQTWKTLSSLMREIEPAFVYCNSMFSVYFSLYPLLYRKLNKVTGQYVLAPRGMLRHSALAIKPLRKKIFLRLFRWLGLGEGVVFQATDAEEEKDIRLLSEKVRVQIAANLGRYTNGTLQYLHKEPNQLNLVFVGRVHPIKNLDFLISVLAEVKGRCSLSVAGPIEDKVYWEKCQGILKNLDSDKEFIYLGEVAPTLLEDIIRKRHVLVLPTRGENFGHSIFEAMCLGRPVIISDQTPWRNLEEAKAGLDLHLQDRDAWSKAIQRFADMNQEEYDMYCKGARDLASAYISKSEAIQAYKNLFA